jgi:glutamate--cysteine ligase catalytic subunit
MGLLILGAPLAWNDTKKYIDHVKQHGIEQFINLYRKYEGKTGSVLRWGDEIEYFVCAFDKESRTTSLPLRSPGAYLLCCPGALRGLTSDFDSAII